jgi:hypothetical protein
MACSSELVVLTAGRTATARIDVANVAAYGSGITHKVQLICAALALVTHSRARDASDGAGRQIPWRRDYRTKKRGADVAPLEKSRPEPSEGIGGRGGPAQGGPFHRLTGTARRSLINKCYFWNLAGEQIYLWPHRCAKPIRLEAR